MAFQFGGVSDFGFLRVPNADDSIGKTDGETGAGGVPCDVADDVARGRRGGTVGIDVARGRVLVEDAGAEGFKVRAG